MATPKKIQIKKANANVLQDSPTLKQPKKVKLNKASEPATRTAPTETAPTLQLGGNTQKVASTSSQQHAALGTRIKAGNRFPSPSGQDTKTGSTDVPIVVPTSPQPDTPLPDISSVDTNEPVDVPTPTAPDREGPLGGSGIGKGEEVPSLHKPTMPTNTIMILGFTLILANMFVGGNLTMTGKKLLNKPEGVGPSKTKEGQALLFQFLGEVAFVLLLVTLARIFPNMTRPIVIFLLGVWMVWIIFILPDAIKNYQQQGLLAILGITGNTDTKSTKKPHGEAISIAPHKGGSYYEQGYRGSYSIGV